MSLWADLAIMSLGPEPIEIRESSSADIIDTTRENVVYFGSL